MIIIKTNFMLASKGFVTAKQKDLLRQVFFVWWNEAFPYGNMKQPAAMKTLTLMKCAYGTIRNALLHKFAKRICIMAAKPPLHICKANTSFTKLKIYDILNLKVGAIMRDDKLSVQSMDFAVSIINLVKELKLKKENIISNQIGRSGTSIGANIREAQYAHGKADFVSKLQIALNVANETGYWLELLYKTNYFDESTYKNLDSACTSIRVMLISSVNTVKTKQ